MPDLQKRIGVTAIALSMILCTALTARADSLHDRIQRANGLLRSGDAEKAIDEYHQIQVDHPDSPVLEYNIGCAEYEQGMKALQSQNEKDSQSAFSKARESFDRAIQSDDPEIRASAGFNRANALAQTAKLQGDNLSPEKKIESFHNAIRAYEDVLQTDPSNSGARQNIDHLRYMLKRAMQQPPPEQGEGEQNPQDQNQQKNTQDQNQPQQSQQDEQDQKTQQDRPQDQQEQPEQKPQPQDSPQESQDSEEQRSDQPNPEAEPPQGQTLEALLDSLDQMDKEMQQHLRKAPQKTRIREQAWW